MIDIEFFLKGFGLKYDKFIPYDFNGFAGIKFLDRLCLFFNLNDGNNTIEVDIKKNYSTFLEEFSHTSQKFVYLPQISIISNFESILYYYHPELRNYSICEKEWLQAKVLESLTENENFHNNIYKNILESIGYAGHIQCGLLISFGKDCYVVEISQFNYFLDNSTILDAILLLFKCEANGNKFDFESRNNFKDTHFFLDDLNEEVKEKILQIEKQLKDLEKSGQLLLAMPTIKQIVEENFSKIRIHEAYLSEIKVDYLTYQISLPKYNNIEIKLSYLTKAVYLLFYNNPNGINLNEIHHYKNELFTLYSHICPFDDLDKVKQSIEDITNIETKSIYSHISRIKSSILNLMSYEYAKNYIVTGNYHGDSHKYIPILKSVTYNSNPFDEEDSDIDDDNDLANLQL
jgi:hypothetical protein